MRFNFFLTLASVMVLLLAEMKKADAQMTVAQPIQTKVETESGIRFFEGNIIIIQKIPIVLCQMKMDL